MEKKKQTYTPEQDERRRFTRALAKANRSPEQIVKDEAKRQIQIAKRKKNHPGYRSPCTEDLGYFAVYAIDNYNGTEASYCGQTGNLYNRMLGHKSYGRLNTESHRILQCFRTREQAMAFEAIQHEAGYHGYNNGQ